MSDLEPKTLAQTLAQTQRELRFLAFQSGTTDPEFSLTLVGAKYVAFPKKEGQGYHLLREV